MTPPCACVVSMCADMTGSIIDQYVFRNLLYQRVLTLYLRLRLHLGGGTEKE